MEENIDSVGEVFETGVLRAGDSFFSSFEGALRAWGIVSKRVTRVFSNPSVLGLEQGSLPSETLKSGSLQTGQPRDVAEWIVLRVSLPWLIAQMCRFKFSPERPPCSCG